MGIKWSRIICHCVYTLRPAFQEASKLCKNTTRWIYSHSLSEWVKQRLLNLSFVQNPSKSEEAGLSTWPAQLPWSEWVFFRGPLNALCLSEYNVGVTAQRENNKNSHKSWGLFLRGVFSFLLSHEIIPPSDEEGSPLQRSWGSQWPSRHFYGTFSQLDTTFDSE